MRSLEQFSLRSRGSVYRVGVYSILTNNQWSFTQCYLVYIIFVLKCKGHFPTSIEILTLFSRPSIPSALNIVQCVELDYTTHFSWGENFLTL